MGVASAVLCAEELEGELTVELERARSERLVLKSIDGARIEARVEEKRDFQERAAALQERLREQLKEAANELGVPADSVGKLAASGPQGARLAGLISSIQKLAAELTRENALNQHLAERALTFTKAYVRVLSPRPSAYDRRGAESASAGALGSVSRRA